MYRDKLEEQRKKLSGILAGIDIEIDNLRLEHSDTSSIQIDKLKSKRLKTSRLRKRVISKIDDFDADAIDDVVKKVDDIVREAKDNSLRGFVEDIAETIESILNDV